MDEKEFKRILSIKDSHKRRTELVKLGFFEANKDKRTKELSLVDVAKAETIYEIENIWGKNEEYELIGAYKENCNGFDWIWIEYLVANKTLTERQPKDVWIFAKEV